MKYVYVLSHAFSGSTLLSFLLGSHPDIATVGEVGSTIASETEGYTCSCGEPLVECPFWLSLEAGMRSRDLEFDLADPRLQFRDPSHRVSDRVLRAGVHGTHLEAVRSVAIALLPGLARRRAELVARNEAFAETVLDVSGGSVFLDIFKRPSRLVHLQRSDAIDLHVIHLVRDARAVANSSKNNMGLAAEAGAESWLDRLREAKRVRNRFGDDRWMSLRHEDLCSDPDAALARLHDFLGVGRDDSHRDFRASEQHIIGNRMRLMDSSEIKLDERWRSALSGPELEAVDRVAGAENRELGYG